MATSSSASVAGKKSLRDWLSDKWFAQVHGRNLVYNQCWEDPRLDRQALELTGDDSVLVITSAGCNALDYALDSPKVVHAVDMNSRQNACLQLKQAGIRELDYDTFFKMFGQGCLPELKTLYPEKLRKHLEPVAQKYWDKQLDFFLGQGRRKSFYFHGTSGVFAYMINMYIDKVAKSRGAINEILNAKSIEEQRHLYDTKLGPKMWTKLIKWVLDRDATMSLLGVPRPQRIQIERTYEGGLVKFIMDCVETVFAKLPLHDNYFWRVYLTGEYTKTCCPSYLSETGFHQLKAGLVDRVKTHTDSVAGFLQKTNEPISRFILLDHMDWLSTHRQHLLAEEWQTIVNRAAPKSRVLFRSGGTRVDFVDPIVVTTKTGEKKRIGDMVSYDTELAAKLHQVDRVHTYGSFYIAKFHE